MCIPYLFVDDVHIFPNDWGQKSGCALLFRKLYEITRGFTEPMNMELSFFWIPSSSIHSRVQDSTISTFRDVALLLFALK